MLIKLIIISWLNAHIHLILIILLLSVFARSRLNASVLLFRTYQAFLCVIITYWFIFMAQFILTVFVKLASIILVCVGAAFFLALLSLLMHLFLSKVRSIIKNLIFLYYRVLVKVDLLIIWIRISIIYRWLF